MEQRGDGCRVRSISTLFSLFIILFIFILFGALPVAAGTSFELAPITIYEGTSHLFNFTVTTSHILKPIDQINFSAPSLNTLTATNDSSFNQGWDIATGSSSLLWQNNSIPKGSFVIYTYLQFTAMLPKVTNDTAEQWSITTTDNKNVQTTNLVNVTIKNDATAPILSNLYPTQNGYLRSVQSSASTQSVDPESGVASVGFNFSQCKGNTTVTQVLGKAADTPDNYSATADFSGFAEGASVCFSFISSSNGGETTVSSGNFTIDNTPPAVTALSPADNAFIPSVPNLSFAANDTVSPSVSCVVLVDGSSAATLTLTQSSTLATTPANASDGSHQWSVSCTDLAGNTGQSTVRTVKVDTAPPTVSFSSLPLVIRGRSNTLPATISDFSGISKVSAQVVLNATANQTIPSSSDGNSYAFTVAPESTTELGAYTLSVQAEDGVGHSAINTVSYTVTYNYIINLTTPSTVAAGHDLTFAGIVRMDNASLIKESSVRLMLPDGSSLFVPVDNQSAFSYTFSAPETAGSYPLTAQVLAGNGITYNGTTTVTVESSAASAPSSGAPGSGRGVSRSSGGAPSSSSPGSAASGTSGVSSGVSAASVSSSSPSSSVSGTSSGTSTASASTSADSSGDVGVGRAGGFLTNALIKNSKLIWTVLVVMLVLGVLVYISRGPEGPVVQVRDTVRDSSPPHSPESAFSPSFQQPIQQNTTRHDLDLDEYLRSRLGK